MESFIVNTLLPITIYIIGGAFVILLGFIFIGFLNPANKFKGLIGMGLLAALVFGVYATASGEIPAQYMGKNYAHVTEFVMKYVTTGVTVAVIMIALGFLLWILMEVFNLVK